MKDYEPGPVVCMLVPALVALYDSIETCCIIGMWWVDYGYCASCSVGNYTNGWTVNFQNKNIVSFLLFCIKVTCVFMPGTSTSKNQSVVLQPRTMILPADHLWEDP